MPDRLTLIKNGMFNIIGISSFTFMTVVQLPLLKGHYGKTGRKCPIAITK
jgi:hypothetical protein